MKDFKARKATTKLALKAARDLQYPRRKGEPSGERYRWEEHHRHVLAKLSKMAMESGSKNTQTDIDPIERLRLKAIDEGTMPDPRVY